MVSGPVERGEEIETRFHSRPRTARLVRGPWAEAVSLLVGEPVRLVEPAHGAADRGRGGAATLLGTASLGALAETLGVEDVDGRRFRMNFGIEGLGAHEEDGWLGRRVAVGGAVVVPQGNVGRCVVTTQSPETGRTDLDTLKALAAYRGRRDDRAAALRGACGRRRAGPRPGRRPGRNPLERRPRSGTGWRRLDPQGFTGGGKWGKVGSSGPPAR